MDNVQGDVYFMQLFNTNFMHVPGFYLAQLEAYKVECEDFTNGIYIHFGNIRCNEYSERMSFEESELLVQETHALKADDTKFKRVHFYIFKQKKENPGK
jgi:hypothetical protein